MSNLYLERYAYPAALTTDTPNEKLRLSIVIPCFKEPRLLATLESLLACDLPDSYVEVIVLINEAENSPDAIRVINEKTYGTAQRWAADNSTARRKFLVFYLNNLPPKHAGVGLARKIGMDEAVRRFKRIPHLPAHDAILVCLDADSLCLPNYLQAIERHFQENTGTPACSIHYEHPLEGDLAPAVYTGIIKYELYLRYYVHALRYAGFPYAYQTIGSSMAARLSAYIKQGGMNRKKAGEDFYFLHKIIPLGSFSELTSTMVIPSPRISDRVPFGTGKAIGDWVRRDKPFYPAYNPQTFIALRELLLHYSELFSLSDEDLMQWIKKRDPVIQEFLIQQKFTAALPGLRKQSSDSTQFRKKFFDWLNAFRILKYVHFAREMYYADIPVEEAALWLAKAYFQQEVTSPGAKGLLLFYRSIDRGERVSA